MKRILIKIDDSSKEFDLIRGELAQYNILPDKISLPWAFFKYLCYNSLENIITNYSDIILKTDDHILCESVDEFISEVKKELNIKMVDKEFTLDELKPGMVVEYRNGSKRLVVSINNRLHFISDYEHLDNIENIYNKDLTCIPERNFDIMKIYKVPKIAGLNYLLNINPKKLIWKRPAIKELTLKEIADKFGYSVKQIRIKE